LKRALRGGLIGLAFGLGVTFALKLFSGTVYWELLSLGSLGALVGVALPWRPARLYLWAGRRLAVGEGLLAAWELLRRGEPVLLHKLWEKLAPSLEPPWKLLILQRSEAILLGGILIFSLSLQFAPLLFPEHLTSSAPPTRTVATPDVDRISERKGESASAVGPEPIRPEEWRGEKVPGKWPERETLPSDFSPKGSSSFTPSPAEPSLGDDTGAELPSSSPGEAPAETREGIAELPTQSPFPAAMVPTPQKKGEALLREVEEKGEGEAEGQPTSETQIYRRGDENLPSSPEAPEAVPFPEAQRAGSPGTEELGGRAEGEPPASEGEGIPDQVEPSRKTQAQMRPGEGPARTGTVLSIPPEPSGDEGSPYIPPLGSTGIFLEGRDLPAGAEEIVRRYFSILSQQEAK